MIFNLKKVFLFLTCIFSLCFMAVYAETSETSVPPSCGITDSDISNFIKNYKKIDAELDKLNIEKSDVNTQTMDPERVEILEKLFQKYGITGPGAVAKFSMINLVYITEYTRRSMQSTAVTKFIMKKTESSESWEEMKASINPDDYNLIISRFSDLAKAFGDQDLPPVKETKKDKKSDKEFWTDEDTDELKDAVKEEVKDAAKEAVKETVKDEAKKQLKKGLKNLLPF